MGNKAAVNLGGCAAPSCRRDSQSLDVDSLVVEAHAREGVWDKRPFVSDAHHGQAWAWRQIKEESFGQRPNSTRGLVLTSKSRPGVSTGQTRLSLAKLVRRLSTRRDPRPGYVTQWSPRREERPDGGALAVGASVQTASNVLAEAVGVRCEAGGWRSLA